MSNGTVTCLSIGEIIFAISALSEYINIGILEMYIKYNNTEDLLFLYR